ncbi:class I SAM-dependent methyltransferase [Candidatus Uhrbacteria bacterium]|nr:class I SAM-dependent methyltransferase [Candidatus Uhrbacteria bacterium]
MKDYFVSAASYYARYRPFYPEPLIQDVVDFFILTKNDRVIDIGSGTGQLAIQMAKYVEEVLAVEPDADMIAEGRKLCRKHGIDNIKWKQAAAEKLDASIGTFKIATFGASFHWMEQERILSFLDSVIESEGGVAIAGSQSVWLPTEDWEEVVKQMIQKYLGEERRAGTGKFKQAAKTDERFEDLLNKSLFSLFEERQYKHKREKTIDEIIGRIYSTSFANPAVLGEKKEAFENELRNELNRLNPQGLFEKTENYYLFLAKRP